MQKQNYQGGNATLRPVGGKVPNLPLKREFSKISGMTKGCNWIQNGIKIHMQFLSQLADFYFHFWTFP